MKFDASRLREVRKQKKLTQGELGELVGLSAASINRIEKGLRAPDISLLAEIAKQLEVTITYLIGETDNPNTYEEGELERVAANHIKNIEDKYTRDIIEILPQLSPEQRKSVARMLDELAEANQAIQKKLKELNDKRKEMESKIEEE